MDVYAGVYTLLSAWMRRNPQVRKAGSYGSLLLGCYGLFIIRPAQLLETFTRAGAILRPARVGAAAGAGVGDRDRGGAPRCSHLPAADGRRDALGFEPDAVPRGHVAVLAWKPRRKNRPGANPWLYLRPHLLGFSLSIAGLLVRGKRGGRGIC